MRQSIFIENCSQATILVNTKVKSIFLTKCKDINLIFKVKIFLIKENSLIK